MIKILKADSRGRTKLDWLDSFHSFSFDEYYNLKYMNFNSLRVLNDDTIMPLGGFPTHTHKNMEIITFIVSGELTNIDSTGTEEKFSHGDVQLLRAGTGITHSAFNLDKNNTTRLLQIWIAPRTIGLVPNHQSLNFSNKLKPNQLYKIISKNEKDSTLHITQDVEVYTAKLISGIIEFTIEPNHEVWLQIINGSLTLQDNTVLSQGDGAGITDTEKLVIKFDTESEFLLFDFDK